MVEYHFNSKVNKKYKTLIREMIEDRDFTTFIGNIEITEFQEKFSSYEYLSGGNNNKPKGKVDPLPDFANNEINFKIYFENSKIIFNFFDTPEYIFKHEIFHLIHYSTFFARFEKNEFIARLNKNNIVIHILMEAVAQYCVFSDYIMNSLSKENNDKTKIRIKTLKDPEYNILIENYDLFRPLTYTLVDIIATVKNKGSLYKEGEFNAAIRVRIGYYIGNWLAFHEHFLNSFPSNFYLIQNEFPVFHNIIHSNLKEVMEDIDSIFPTLLDEIKYMKRYI